MNAKLTAQAHMLPTYEIVNDLKMLKKSATLQEIYYV